MSGRGRVDQFCRGAAVALACALLAGACGNSGDDADATADTTAPDAGGTSVPGVTDTEIKIGGLVAVSGPLGQQFRGSEAGFRAYIDYINDQGGVHGRTIDLATVANDNTDTARDLEEAKALVEQEGVFAVAPVSTPVFGAAQYLADEGVPTFGWNIQEEWDLGANLIGYPTSWPRDERPDDPVATQSYIARKLGVEKVGVIAYTAPQSKTCGEQTVAAFQHYGLEVGFEDTSLPLGATDLTADVQRMKDAGVGYVVTCIDVNGNVLLARSLQRAGLDIPMSWPTGYEEKTLESFGELMDNVYFTTGFLPFESAASSEGLQLYLEELPKREPDAEIGNQTLIGWINAMMLVGGLEAAGPDLTRDKLVDAVRAMTDFDADGIIAPTDLSTPPEDRPEPAADEPAACGGAVVTVDGGEFTPVFNEPFLCLGDIATAEDLDALLAEEGSAG